MNEPLVSVIVPVYKVGKYLDKCVESIVGQTYKNLEIILVDDGSPDNCPAMCDKRAERDSRIKVIHKQNGGVSSARNVGIDAAQGEFIGFVDSDDWLEPDMYDCIVKNALEYNADISRCGYFVDWSDHTSYVGSTEKKINLPDSLLGMGGNAFERSGLETVITEPLRFGTKFTERLSSIPSG